MLTSRIAELLAVTARLHSRSERVKTRSGRAIKAEGQSIDPPDAVAAADLQLDTPANPGTASGTC